MQEGGNTEEKGTCSALLSPSLEALGQPHLGTPNLGSMPLT